VTKKKVSQYAPKIKDGFPSDRAKTEYDTKIFDGALKLIAEQIEHGQYVEISAGSQGKFKKIVESRGLKTVHRRGQGEPIATIYVVTPEWLATHPDV